MNDGLIFLIDSRRGIGEKNNGEILEVFVSSSEMLDASPSR